MPSHFIPAPTGGLNLRDHDLLMPETDARTLENFVPDNGYCRMRGGVTEFDDLGSNTVHTLATIQTATDELLLAIHGTAAEASGGGAFSDVTDGETITSGTPWQHCVFRNRLILVNGTDVALEYPKDGTDTTKVDALSYTGPATPANLINVAPYKSRLYFIEEDDTGLWYGGVDSIEGALTEFDLASILHKGGVPVYAGASTRAGYVNQDVLCIISSKGEVIAYQGNYPGDSTWTIIGRWFIAPPLSYRCAFHVGADLHFITKEGIVPMSQLLAGSDVDYDYLVPSGKIRPLFSQLGSQSAIDLRSTWQAIHYPDKRYVMINEPEDGSQLIMNTSSKAWGRFTGWSISSMAVFLEDLYFGETGTGKVYKADVLYANDTNSQIITDASIDHAYNFLGDPRNNKKITTIQPLITIQRSGGSETAVPDVEIGANMDLSQDGRTFVVPATATPTTAKLNKFTCPIEEHGKTASVNLRISAGVSSISTDFRYFGSWVDFEKAGPL